MDIVIFKQNVWIIKCMINRYIRKKIQSGVHRLILLLYAKPYDKLLITISNK